MSLEALFDEKGTEVKLGKTETVGRCVLHATRAAGFTRVKVRHLNACIAPALRARAKASPLNKYREGWTEDMVGRKNEAWALDVVLLALKLVYGEGHFVWRAMALDQFNEHAASGQLRGKFFISGILEHANWSAEWTAAELAGYTRLDWHHAICVDFDTNCIIDSNCQQGPVTFCPRNFRAQIRWWFQEIFTVRRCAVLPSYYDTLNGMPLFPEDIQGDDEYTPP